MNTGNGPLLSRSGTMPLSPVRAQLATCFRCSWAWLAGMMQLKMVNASCEAHAPAGVPWDYERWSR